MTGNWTAGTQDRAGAVSPGFSAATWVRNTGIVILLFFAYQLWLTGAQEHRYQVSLRRAFVAAALRADPPGTPPPVAGPAPVGSAVARLTIAAIGLDQYVVEGTDRHSLSEGPGHFADSPLPGEPGNVVISGHRSTSGSPFANLDRLRAGDAIVVTTLRGRFRYVVSGEPFVASPTQAALIGPRAGDLLTLVTCTPRYSAQDRLVVVARSTSQLVSRLATSNTRAAVDPAALSSDAGWQWGRFPVVLVVTAVLVGLGLGLPRIRPHFDRVGLWLVLGPVWVAGLWILFESARALLPADL